MCYTLLKFILICLFLFPLFWVFSSNWVTPTEGLLTKTRSFSYLQLEINCMNMAGERAEFCQEPTHLTMWLSLPWWLGRSSLSTHRRCTLKPHLTFCTAWIAPQGEEQHLKATSQNEPLRIAQRIKEWGNICAANPWKGAPRHAASWAEQAPAILHFAAS